MMGRVIGVTKDEPLPLCSVAMRCNLIVGPGRNNLTHNGRGHLKRARLCDGAKKGHNMQQSVRSREAKIVIRPCRRLVRAAVR